MGHRVSLFSAWSIRMQIWNGSRTEDGRFSKIHKEQYHDPVLKKQRKEKFDFGNLHGVNDSEDKCIEITEV